MVWSQIHSGANGHLTCLGRRKCPELSTWKELGSQNLWKPGPIQFQAEEIHYPLLLEAEKWKKYCYGLYHHLIWHKSDLRDSHEYIKNQV